MGYYYQQFRSVDGIAPPEHRPEVAAVASGQQESDAELVLWRQGAVPTFDLVYLDNPDGHQVAESTEPNAKPAEPKAKRTELKAKPTEATAKPTEATAKPAEAKAKPAEAKAKPAEAKAKPAEAKAKPAEPKEEPTDPKVCVEPNPELILPMVENPTLFSEGTPPTQAEPGAPESRVPWEEMFKVREANAKFEWARGHIKAIHQRIGSLDRTLPELGDFGAVKKEFFRMDRTLVDLHRAVCGEHGKPQQFEHIMISRFAHIRKDIVALNAQLEKLDGMKTSTNEELKKLDERLKKELKEITKQREALASKRQEKEKKELERVKKRKKRKNRVSPPHDRPMWDSMTPSDQLNHMEDLGKLRKPAKPEPAKQAPGKQAPGKQAPAKADEKRKR